MSTTPACAAPMRVRDRGGEAGRQPVGRDRRDDHVVDLRAGEAGVGEGGVAGLRGERGERWPAGR